jgi:hypothetical protein
MVGAVAPPAPGTVPPGNTLPAVSPQYAAVQPTEDKAVISMVLGILSLVGLSILAGIPAIILGKMSRDNIRASSGRLTGEGMATAGIVMGWVSVGIAVVFLLLMVLMVFYLIPSH